MAQTTLISVVVPVYQGNAYVRQAVESVLSQEGVAFELVIGDDGSTDGSRAYLESLRDPRVRLFPGKGRTGLFPHLNRLLARCRGTVVRFLCQDDILEPGCLAAEAAYFESHPKVGLTFAKYRTIGSNGAFLTDGVLGDLPDILPSMLAVQQLFYHGCIAGNLSTVAVRMSALRQAGFFDESFHVSGDYELWARLAPHHDIGLLHRHLVRVRTHERQLSRAKTSAVPFVLENARVRQALLPALPARAQAAARRFERKRHRVLDVHLALRCVLAGRFREAKTIVGSFGALGTAEALGYWAWTLNNRRRPQAPWILPSAES